MKLSNIILTVAILLVTSCDVKVVNKNTIHHLPKAVSKFANTKDPVCGMDVDNSYTDTLVHQDKLVGFCSATCLKEFTKNPSGFVLK